MTNDEAIAALKRLSVPLKKTEAGRRGRVTEQTTYLEHVRGWNAGGSKFYTDATVVRVEKELDKRRNRWLEAKDALDAFDHVIEALHRLEGLDK